MLHRFVFNLKRLINLIPGGKSKLGTYAAALGLLLKENKDIFALIKHELRGEQPVKKVVKQK